jgi:hypothetical protein
MIPGLIPQAEPAETRVRKDGRVYRYFLSRFPGWSSGFLERKEDSVE